MRWKGLLAGLAPILWWIGAKYGYIWAGLGIEAINDLPGLTPKGATPAELLFILAIALEIALIVGVVWSITNLWTSARQQEQGDEAKAIAVLSWIAIVGYIFIRIGWYCTDIAKADNPYVGSYEWQDWQLLTALGWVMGVGGAMIAVGLFITFDKQPPTT